MNFLVPLGFLFALFLPAIIILYILKLKRINTSISSTLLWKQSLEDLRANAPFQKLKNNLLMILQLIAVAILMLAIARPVLQLSGLDGESYVVLIDQSASMSATDESPNRLEKAKKKAIELVNDMSVGDQMMVVAFSSSAHVLNPFVQDKGILREKIRAIQPTDNPTSMNEAVSIAISAADLHPKTRVMIFSDGQFDIPEDSLLAAVDVSFIPIGNSSENIGIVDVVIRNDFELESKTQVLAGVQNHGETTQEVYLELYGIQQTEIQNATSSTTNDEPQKELLDAYKLLLEGGQRETVIFNDPGSYTSVIEVKLDTDDFLKTDNQAWAVVPNQDEMKVLFVTEGNFYLQRALNLDPRVRLSTTPPGNYIGPEDFDLIVFDTFSPTTLVNGNYVFVNSVPMLPDWSMGDTLELPGIVDWNRSHPLNKYLSYENLDINECRNLGIPDWAEVILESRETALIASFVQDKIRGVVIGFDVYDSSWPLRVSFPIFFSNMLDWFQKQTRFSQSVHHMGDILSIEPPDLITENLKLTGPNGYEKAIEFNENAPVYISDIEQVGIYEFQQENQSKIQYAYNLISSDESNITPVKSLVFGRVELMGDIEAVSQNQEIWRYLVIAALLIVIIEWFIFSKRAKYSL